MPKMEFCLGESKCEEVIANKLLEVISDVESDVYLENIIFNNEIIDELKSLKEKLQNIKFKVVR